jgi:hypothetical protein
LSEPKSRLVTIPVERSPISIPSLRSQQHSDMTELIMPQFDTANTTPQTHPTRRTRAVLLSKADEPETPKAIQYFTLAGCLATAPQNTPGSPLKNIDMQSKPDVAACKPAACRPIYIAGADVCDKCLYLNFSLAIIAIKQDDMMGDDADYQHLDNTHEVIPITKAVRRGIHIDPILSQDFAAQVEVCIYPSSIR